MIEKNFWNSRLKAETLQKFSRSLEQFFFTVSQNNFGNKIPIYLYVQFISWARASTFELWTFKFCCQNMFYFFHLIEPVGSAWFLFYLISTFDALGQKIKLTWHYSSKIAKKMYVNWLCKYIFLTDIIQNTGMLKKQFAKHSYTFLGCPCLPPAHVCT